MKGGRWVALLLVLALAAFLRWVPGAGLALGVDEGVSILSAAPPLDEIFPRMRASHEVHPPLYAFYLHPWVAAVRPGAFELGGGEAWLRLSSLPWALLVVALTMAIGLRTGGRSVALAAGLLAATSDYLIYYALELRMYGMLTTFVLGAVWAALAGRRWLAVACCALAFLTHYEALFLIAALGVCIALDGSGDRRAWAAPALVLVVLVGAWVPLIREQAAGQALLLREAPSWPQGVELAFQLVWGLTWPVPLPGWAGANGLGGLHPVKWLGLAGALLVGGGVVRAAPRDRRLLVCFLGVPAAAMFGLSAFTSLRVFEFKYFQPVCPFVCLALAQWVVSRESDTSSWHRRMGAMGVCVVMAVNVVAWGGFVRAADWYGPQDWRGVVKTVAPMLRPSDVLLVHPSMMAAPVVVQAYLGERRLFTAEGATRVVPVDEPDAPALRDALTTASGGFLLTPLAHPYVIQQRLAERLPSPWTVVPCGGTESFWPANRIQVFRLIRQ